MSTLNSDLAQFIESWQKLIATNLLIILLNIPKEQRPLLKIIITEGEKALTFKERLEKNENVNSELAQFIESWQKLIATNLLIILLSIPKEQRPLLKIIITEGEKALTFKERLVAEAQPLNKATSLPAPPSQPASVSCKVCAASAPASGAQ